MNTAEAMHRSQKRRGRNVVDQIRQASRVESVERQARRQSRLLMKDVVRAMPNSVWIYDADEKWAVPAGKLGEMAFRPETLITKYSITSREAHAAMMLVPCEWHGANLYGTPYGEAEPAWYMRLLATGTACREGDTSLLQYLLKHDADTFCDWNIGNGALEDLWLAGSYQGRDLAVMHGRLFSLYPETREALLSQPVIEENAHVYALNAQTGERFYLLTNLTALGTDADDLVGRWIIENGGQGTGDTMVESPQPGEEWAVRAICVEEGKSWCSMIFNRAEYLAKQIGDQTMTKATYSRELYPSQEEAIAAGKSDIEACGATVVPDPRLEHLASPPRVECDDETARAQRKLDSETQMGWRGDARLVREIAADHGEHLAKRWQAIPYIWFGPRVDEIIQRGDELRREVPELSYLPTLDFVLDFGLVMPPMGGRQDDVPAVLQTWARVTRVDEMIARGFDRSPFMEPLFPRERIRAAFTEQRPPEMALLVQVMTYLPITDEWLTPTAATVKTDEWWTVIQPIVPDATRKRIEAHGVDRAEFEKSLRAQMRVVLCCVAYLAVAPELLYRVDPKPRPKEKGAKSSKPHTRTDLPHYRLLDPRLAPRPKGAPSGGTHASPHFHTRIATRRTLFAPRYYQEHSREFVYGARPSSVKPLLSEVHYDQPTFCSGRRDSATAEVWTKVGPSWFPLRVRQVYVPPCEVGDRRAYEGSDGATYRVVDPGIRERGARLVEGR